jgi:uncharacterized protein (UPF0261 family)
MAKIAVLGTLDTKGAALDFLTQSIRSLGHTPVLIDVGTGKPASRIPADIPKARLLELTGVDLLQPFPHRAAALAAMSEAARKILGHLHEEGKIAGVIALGGLAGTSIVSAGLRALPLGFPKLLVSSVLGANNDAYVDRQDIVLFPSLTALGELNRFLRKNLASAAGAICGIVQFAINTRIDPHEKPLVLVSTHPQISAAVDRATSIIEGAGYEVLHLEANGQGGRALEAILSSGLAQGVLDMCLREISDEVIPGGSFSAGPSRLEAAARNAIPTVLVPGCAEILTLAEDPKALAPLRERTFHKYNAQFRYMRADNAECETIGLHIAQKANLSLGPVTVLLPLRGNSGLSLPGKPFHDPAADRALFKSIKDHLRRGIQLLELKATIHDTPFADACARALLGNIKAKARTHENLQKVEFFETESEEFLREMAAHMETQTFLPGDYIIREEEVGESMYFMDAGAAEVLLHGKRIAKLGSGAPFGEMALVSGAPRVASVRALEYCDVHRLSKEDFDHFRKLNPAFDRRVQAIIKQRTLANLQLS